MANRGEAFDENVHCIEDLRERGSAKLPKMYRDYFNEGAMDMVTLRDNEEACNRYKIRPRILVNVDNIDLSTEFLGNKVSMPLGTTVQLLRRAEAGGCKAIFISVDVPVLGRRLNEHRNKFALPEGMGWPDLLSDGKSETSGQQIGASQSYYYDPSLDWDTAIPWLRSQTRLPLWLKGVTSSDDVELAIKHGLNGVVISNHGGRQLDGQPATLDALRECAITAGGRISVAVDGGIRRGTDLFKALALGATFCFVGRVPIWGLAYNGQQGVELGLKILVNEFKLAMGLAGCRSVKDISRSHITDLNSEGRLAKL